MKTKPYVPSYLSIAELKVNDTNPRSIDDVKFAKLVKSVREFPKMLEIRPIVIDENNVILGGNMRYKACVEAGLKEVPIMLVTDFTDEQKQEFIMKDNIAFGKWDWELVSEQFDAYQLDEWALDLDPKMFNIEADNETMDEAKDTTKFNDYTIYFADERQMDIWYAFLKNLKMKFGDYENISDRVLRYIAEVYEDNGMTESERIMKFIEFDVDE